MVQYKLHYFDIRGFGEVPRMLFEYAGVPYEDIRITHADWPKIKPTTPNGQVPVLEVDGQAVVESGAIIRYLARKFGLTGKDEWDALKCDELFCWYYDMTTAHKWYALHKAGIVPSKEPEKLRADYIPLATKVLEHYTKKLTESGSGFFLKSGFSYADLVLHTHVNQIRNVEPELFEQYPTVKAHFDRVNNLPQLKAFFSRQKPCVY